MEASSPEVKYEGAAREINLKIEARRLWAANIVESQGLGHLWRWNDSRCAPPLSYAQVSKAFFDSRPDAIARELSSETRDDIGNGRRFVVRNREKLVYCPGVGWYEWRGGRWRALDLPAVVTQYATPVAEGIIRELEEMSGEQAEEVSKFARKVRTVRCLRDMTAQASGDPHIRVSGAAAFDPDPWLLNCPNGVLDLRDGMLREHRREDLCTKVSGVAFDPGADCPRWEQFIREITCGRAELGEFLCRAAGYMLTGVTREQALFFLWGDGSNGKSVFAETLAGVLGDYAVHGAADLLTEGRGEAHASSVAMLQGARMVVCSETDEGRYFSEGLIKRLTGDDNITAKRLYQEPFTFRPTHKILLLSNPKPRVRGGGHALWRRLRLVPFEARFDGAGIDPGLRDALRSEWPGILAWCVSGCLDWQAGGLRAPAEVMAAGEEYRLEQNPVAEWASERCEFDPLSPPVPSAVLHRAFCTWSEERHQRPLSAHKFTPFMVELGAVRDNSNKHVRALSGVRLKVSEMG